MPEMAHPVGLHRLAADFYLIGQQARSVSSPSLLLIRVFIIGVRAGACPVDTLQAMQADSSPTCDAHTTHTLTPNMTHTLFCCPVAPMQIMGRLRTIQEDTASLQRHRVDYDNNGQPPATQPAASRPVCPTVTTTMKMLLMEAPVASPRCGSSGHRGTYLNGKIYGSASLAR